MALQNPLLARAEQAYVAKISPGIKPAVDRIVQAGMEIMHSQQTHDMMAQQIQKPGDPAENAGEGVAKLMGILFNKSKGTMPPKAIAPAANILLVDGLDFMEQAGMIKVDETVLADATKELSSSLMQLLGADPEKMAQGAQKIEQAPPAMQQAAQQQPAPSGILGSAM